ncbi:hypothetical protein ACWGR4_42160 [Embleya sp. NPDC055664]|uniref:hypothetical protein n=1 Tax=Embleya sp. NPDC059237 TaxID=3346784 RepID=UPI0036AB0407
MENQLYLRKPALSGLLVAASVIALSSGCGLADKVKGDDDKKKDPATAAPQAGGSTGNTTGGATGAPATAPGGGKGTAPATAPGTTKPGGTGNLDPKAFCELLTPAELKGVLNTEVTRTKNDDTLRTCRYYGPGDSGLVTLQYFLRSSKGADTPESVVAKNEVSKYGKPITDLGAFPTLYVPGTGSYPAPSVPEVYFAKTHGDVIVDMHVSLSPAAKDLPRAQHIAIAKIIADKI